MQTVAFYDPGRSLGNYTCGGAHPIFPALNFLGVFDIFGLRYIYSKSDSSSWSESDNNVIRDNNF